MLHFGLVGDENIRIAVPAESGLVSTFFERRWYSVNRVEPGSMPLEAVRTGYSFISDGLIFVVASYRCTRCRTTFIVPKVEDLAHKCTERQD